MSSYVMTKATLAPAAANLGAILSEQSAGDNGHRLIWTLFSRDATATRDFLFRAVDERTYLVISQRQPTDPHAIWQMEPPKAYQPEPSNGERYSFILRANPSRDIKRPGQRSQRVDSIMHEKRDAKAKGLIWSQERESAAALSWLFSREGTIGVRFGREECQAASYQQQRILRKQGVRRSAQDICMSTVDFQGILEVTDAATFVEKLKSGIGRGRAFGNGLMLIKRA